MTRRSPGYTGQLLIGFAVSALCPTLAFGNVAFDEVAGATLGSLLTAVLLAISALLRPGGRADETVASLARRLRGRVQGTLPSSPAFAGILEPSGA